MTAPSETKAGHHTHDHGRLLRDGAVIVALLVQFGVFIWQASRVVTSVDNLNVTMREVRKDLKDVTTEMVVIKVDHAKLEAAIMRKEAAP